MKKNVLRRILALVAAFVMVFVSVKPADVYAAPGSYTNPTKGAVSQKGLQIDFGMLSDVEELGISEAFLNIPLERVLSNSATKYAYDYNGKTYYFNTVIEDYDTIISKLTEAGINITAAFINQYQDGYEYLLYPGVTRHDGTFYYAINTATSEGRNAVEAVCHFIAARYNGTGKGKISNYVIGNEVNDNMAYNYIGEMGIDQYVPIYYQTFKTMYDALRAENSGANVYIPLEQRWTTDNTSKEYAGRDFLEIFDRLSKQDGNIYWNLAYHPYSFPITNNNVLTDNWPSVDKDGVKNDGGEITDAQDTKLISMKNINVLTDYMQNSNMRDRDGKVRSIILSEQGYTSESPISGTDEKLQAASIAYAYYASEMNPYIDAFILNGHIDTIVESNYYKFGLWNSVWSNEKNEYVATTPKYAYNMYKYIDTDRSLSVTDFALETLGITSWDAVIDNFDASKFNNMKSFINGNIYAVSSMSDASGAVVLSEGLGSGFTDEDGDGNWVAAQPYWERGYNVPSFSVYNYNKDGVAGTAQYHPNGTAVVDPKCTGYSYQAIYHEFDGAQDFSAAPYLGFTIKLMPQYTSGDSDKMVVRVRVYSGNNIYDANCQVDVNTDYNLFVDLHDWSGVSSVDKVAVWVKENTTSKSYDGVFTVYNFTKASGISGAVRYNRAVNDVIKNVPDSIFNSTVYGGKDYSAVYNADYYYNNNADVAAAVGYNPVLLIEHFVTKGMAAGLQGSEKFNVQVYKNNYKDLANSFGNDLKKYYEHYVDYGKAEGRTAVSSDAPAPTPTPTPTPTPSASYVVDGVDYAAVFNPEYYSEHNKDVVNAFGNTTEALLNHFVTYGMNEGRQGSEEFSVEAYKYNNPDLVNVFGNDTRTYYIHYIKYGKAEGRKATGSTGNGGNSGGNQGGTAAGNYVVDGVDYSAVFNADYYYNNHKDVANAFGKDAQALFNHFMEHGIYEGRQASEEFNVEAYKANNADLVNAFGSDTRTYYIHYIKYGKAEGRKAAGSTGNGGNNSGNQGGAATGNYVVDGVDYSAVFNADYYYDNHKDVANAFGKDAQALFNHFMNYGINEGRQASEEFNVEAYKANNPDLVNVFGGDTRTYYVHYVKYGKAENRKATGSNGGNQGSTGSYVVDGVDYSAVFDADYYYAHHKDVANAFGNDKQALFNHFMNYGINEGRQASEEFNLDVYKANNADLVNTFGDDTRTYYIHYIKYGKSENRKSH